MTAQARLRREFEANHDDARSLIRRLTESQLNRRKPGTWSVADCLAHLAQTNTTFGIAITDAIKDPSRRPNSGIGAPKWLDSWMIRMLEPPVRVKFKSPSQFAPNPTNRGKEILDAYIESHQSLLAALNSPGIENIRFRHPVRRLNLTIMTGLRAMAAHDRRHLWQAKRVDLADD